MLKRALLACLLFAFASPAASQDASWYVGSWRDLPMARGPGDRVVLHHVEFTLLPTLRAPQQFNVHLWARCAENPEAACDMGAMTGVARTLRDGSIAIFVQGTPRRGDVTLPCRVSILFASAYYPDDPTHPDSRKLGIDYRLTPPAGPCSDTRYHGTLESGGTMDRMIMLRPDARPGIPTLPRRP